MSSDRPRPFCRPDQADYVIPTSGGADMSVERRYQDHEIRAILELAVGQKESPVQALPAADGLTLVELQAVGREVGLPAERITQAVALFDGRGASAARSTTLGLPTSIGRIVALPRSPSDREWELLIAELRTTFGGKGEVTSQGGLREWSRGRLHAFIEPTATGHRLRLVDSNEAVAGIVVGGLLAVFTLLMLALLFSKEGPSIVLALPAFISLLGASLAAGSAISLPRWAREQERRMEYIGQQALSLLAPSERDDSHD